MRQVEMVRKHLLRNRVTALYYHTIQNEKNFVQLDASQPAVGHTHATAVNRDGHVNLADAMDLLQKEKLDISGG